MKRVDTLEELHALADTILLKNADWMAYNAGAAEQFYYIINCHRVIRGYRQLLEEK